jgi:hypothetical protein
VLWLTFKWTHSPTTVGRQIHPKHSALRLKGRRRLENLRSHDRTDLASISRRICIAGRGLEGQRVPPLKRGTQWAGTNCWAGSLKERGGPRDGSPVDNTDRQGLTCTRCYGTCCKTRRPAGRRTRDPARKTLAWPRPPRPATVTQRSCRDPN